MLTIQELRWETDVPTLRVVLDQRVFAGEWLLGWITCAPQSHPATPWRAYCVTRPPAQWFATQDEAISHIINETNRTE